MVSDLFGTFLSDLARALDIPALHADGNNSCLITLKNTIQIQLEMDRENEFMILGTDIGPCPAGRFRENLFREALKANNLPNPRYGIFCYSTKTEHLLLYDRFRGREMNADIVAEYIAHFSEKALTWRDAMSRGEVPVVEQVRTSRSSMFGLR